MKKINLIELAASLNDAGIPPRFEPYQSRLLFEVWQRLLNGRPVAIEAVGNIARKLEIEVKTAEDFVKQVSERNDAEDILGIVGLSLRQHPHQLQINGRDFSTWCAWDSLFLPLLLDQPAQITSIDPLSKKKIMIKVSAEKVQGYAPETAVLSLVVPTPEKEGLPSVEEAWTIFCHQVHFFESAEAAHQWFVNKDFDYSVLSIEEGFELGRLAFKDLLETVQNNDNYNKQT